MTMPMDGLVLWWKLDEADNATSVDSSGNDLDFGTNEDQVNDTVASRLVLEKSDSAVALSDILIDDALTAVDGDPDPDGLSVSWWQRNVSFSPGSAAATIANLVSAPRGSDTIRIASSDVFDVNTWQVTDGPSGNGVYNYVRTSWGDSPAQICFSGILSGDTWYHQCVTWDKATRALKFYQDGVETDSIVVTGTGEIDFNTASVIQIAPTGGFNSIQHTVRIRDIAIHARALSASEVQQVYGATAIVAANVSLAASVESILADASMTRLAHHYIFRDSVPNTTKTRTFVATEALLLECVAVRTMTHTASSTVEVTVEIDGAMLQYPVVITGEVGSAESHLSRVLYDNSKVPMLDATIGSHPFTRPIARGSTVTITMTSDSVDPVSMIETVLCLRQALSRGNR